MSRELKIGEKVYHRDIYEHGEQMEIVGIRKTEVELEGDYSGGTHCSKGKQWKSIKGVSRVYHHKYKQKVRNEAIEILAIACEGAEDHKHNFMMKMAHAVMALTDEISLNPEFV